MKRLTLPNRRRSESLAFEQNGARYHASYSRNESGEIAEVFLGLEKPGGALDDLCRDLAVTASIALQFGAPVANIRHALTRTHTGAAAGPLGKLLDFIAGAEIVNLRARTESVANAAEPPFGPDILQLIDSADAFEFGGDDDR